MSGRRSIQGATAAAVAVLGMALLAAPGAAPDDEVTFTPRELRRIFQHSPLEAPPASGTNRYADDVNAARLGLCLETRGNVYAVAEQIVSLDDDVAEVDADAERHATILRQCGVGAAELGLNRERAAYGLEWARELDHDAIPRAAEDAAFVLAHEPIDEASVVFEGGEGDCLVAAH